MYKDLFFNNKMSTPQLITNNNKQNDNVDQFIKKFSNLGSLNSKSPRVNANINHSQFEIDFVAPADYKPPPIRKPAIPIRAPAIPITKKTNTLTSNIAEPAKAANISVNVPVNITPIKTDNLPTTNQIEKVDTVSVLDTENKSLDTLSIYNSKENILSGASEVRTGRASPLGDSLRDILRDVTINTDPKDHTHITHYGPCSRWTIPDHKKQEFWLRYCQLVHSQDPSASSLSKACLAERPQETMPVIVNMTLKFKYDKGADDTHYYNEIFIKEVCKVFQDTICEYYKVESETKFEVGVVVLESIRFWDEIHTDTKENFKVRQIRLQFPYARVDAEDQIRFIKPRAIGILRNKKTLTKLHPNLVGDWENIIQNGCNYPITMYGSSDGQNIPILVLTHVWPYLYDDTIEEALIDDIFVPVNHCDVQNQIISQTIFADKDKDIIYWLPICLSIGYWPTILPKKGHLKDDGRFTRANHNNDESEKIDINDKNAIIRDDSHYVLVTKHFLYNASNGVHTEVAEALLFTAFQPGVGYKYHDTTLLQDIKSKEFFLWDDTTKLWKQYCIENHHSNLKTKAFTRLIERLTDWKIMLENDDSTNKESLEILIRKIDFVVRKLKTRVFRNAVWDHVLELIGVDMFKNADVISPVIPMNDGYNMNIFTHEKYQRTPNDRYTFSINAHFVDDITDIIPNEKSSQGHKDIFDFLWKISCEEEDFLLAIVTIFGIFISGDTADQLIALFLGEGNNAKSIIEKLFYLLLGNYAGCVSSNALYDSGGKTAAGSHTAHIDALTGKRIVLNSESNKKARGWNMDFIKKVTGGDKFDNRAPYARKTENINLPIHVLILANWGDLPPVDGNDPAIQKRYLIFPMRAFFDTGRRMKFKREPLKKYIADSKLVDNVLSKPECLNAFYTIISLAAKQYYDSNYNLVLPKCVIDATDEFLNGSFRYADFIREFCFENLNDNSFRCNTHELYQLYKEVHRGKYDGRNIFRKHMDAKYKIKRSNGEYYPGITINYEAVEAFRYYSSGAVTVGDFSKSNSIAAAIDQHTIP